MLRAISFEQCLKKKLEFFAACDHNFRLYETLVGSKDAMAQKEKNRPIQPFLQLNFAPGSYLESTSQPLYTLFFLLPLIGLYELGTLMVNTDQLAHTQARVAAFTWLVGLAEWIGVHRSLAWAFPGFVVIVILLCWHMSSHYPWKINIQWLGWMAMECLLLTLPLFALAALVNSSGEFQAFASQIPGTHAPNGEAGRSYSYLAHLVTSVGAGIYEELVFRLILVGLILLITEDLCKVKSLTATIIAVLVSAALFSAHHYVGVQEGHIVRLAHEPFTIPSFMFRTVAGIYFAILFRYRGYGITAGTHAVYNVIYFSFR